MLEGTASEGEDPALPHKNDVTYLPLLSEALRLLKERGTLQKLHKAIDVQMAKSEEARRESVKTRSEQVLNELFPEGEQLPDRRVLFKKVKAAVITGGFKNELRMDIANMLQEDGSMIRILKDELEEVVERERKRKEIESKNGNKEEEEREAED